ncbi:DUF916 and DUF3324 domain-containing protein [Vagococcus sp.]|uniref:DUF916 and DUF3324 domain-containing protein n=1 Tax=Vagococcus sp. TaxID=1933889 RepID=UPI002FC92105
MVNRKRLRYIFLTLLSLMMALIGAGTVSAEDNGGFTYTVNFPENQLKKNIGSYHLMMKPGQEQTVTITMANPGKEKSVINVAVNSTKTNSNGVLENGDNNIKNDKSLKFDIKKIISAPKKVELKPGEKKDVEFKIKMPETSFEGFLSGGIQMIQAGQGEDLKKSKGTQVINEYAYVIGIILRENENDIKPELKLNSVKAGQANYKNTIFVNYSNIKGNFVREMTTEVQIMEKGKDTVIYEKKQSKMRMGPNTAIDFPVDMNGEAMKAGNYTAKILVTADEGIREEWTKDFKITKEDADKFNERDVGLVQEKGLDWKLIAIIVVGFFVFVAIIFIIVHLLKKNKKKSKSKSSSKKRKKK